MEHARFIEAIGDYCGNSLTPKERELFERRLKSDTNLASFLKSYKMTTAFCGEVLKHKIPDGAQDRLSTYLKNHIEKLKTKQL